MPGIEYLLEALTPINILLALGGVIAGTIIGSLPGLTATMAVAVLVPITFTMPPASALILMGAIYTGAIYGGAYAAILLNTPGTPSAIATTFFPLVLKSLIASPTSWSLVSRAPPNEFRSRTRA